MMSSQTPQRKQKQPKKPIYRIANPYEKCTMYDRSKSYFPVLSNLLNIVHSMHPNAQVQDKFVELLTNTLSPVASTPISRGKKRKGMGAKNRQGDQITRPVQAAAASAVSIEPVEVLSNSKTGQHLSTTDTPENATKNKDFLIGFNAVTRHLETLSGISCPARLRPSLPDKRRPESVSAVDVPRHVAAVFLLRPLDDLIYSHLPLLCQTASLAYPDRPGTRLVLLDGEAERHLAKALGMLPRVSMVAVLDHISSMADDDVVAEELVAYARQHVDPVEVPWLKQALDAQWLGTRIEVQDG